MNKENILAALKKLAEAALELSNALDESDYQLSDAAPDYLKDADDFAYEISSFVEDEIEMLKSKTLVHTA